MTIRRVIFWIFPNLKNSRYSPYIWFFLILRRWSVWKLHCISRKNHKIIFRLNFGILHENWLSNKKSKISRNSTYVWKYTWILNGEIEKTPETVHHEISRSKEVKLCDRHCGFLLIFSNNDAFVKTFKTFWR